MSTLVLSGHTDPDIPYPLLRAGLRIRFLRSQGTDPLPNAGQVRRPRLNRHSLQLERGRQFQQGRLFATCARCEDAFGLIFVLFVSRRGDLYHNMESAVRLDTHLGRSLWCLSPYPLCCEASFRLCYSIVAHELQRDPSFSLGIVWRRRPLARSLQQPPGQ
jgi:hypothetical protein